MTAQLQSKKPEGYQRASATIFIRMLVRTISRDEVVQRRRSATGFKRIHQIQYVFFRYCLKQFMLTILKVVALGSLGAASVLRNLGQGGGSVPILNEQLDGHINNQFSLAYSRGFNACQVW
jgi:hypothetical protein